MQNPTSIVFATTLTKEQQILFKQIEAYCIRDPTGEANAIFKEEHAKAVRKAYGPNMPQILESKDSDPDDETSSFSNASSTLHGQDYGYGSYILNMTNQLQRAHPDDLSLDCLYLGHDFTVVVRRTAHTPGCFHLLLVDTDSYKKGDVFNMKKITKSSPLKVRCIGACADDPDLTYDIPPLFPTALPRAYQKIIPSSPSTEPLAYAQWFISNQRGGAYSVTYGSQEICEINGTGTKLQPAQGSSSQVPAAISTTRKPFVLSGLN
ncbi:hypothetical protein K435DRAFT_967737 [Dendrothele bispora CBS 962.96]|uniref:Uncharacterized protein n=1 Tax=Dendrothele bispora (strain CBS 962.96) TaxID=1314807 RepID=A0A4S8LS09_DENBC|nr:hypothetical protein K435DRAFT_967737 [Dendrothele bispora CBS 962.96]